MENYLEKLRKIKCADSLGVTLWVGLSVLRMESPGKIIPTVINALCLHRYLQSATIPNARSLDRLLHKLSAGIAPVRLECFRRSPQADNSRPETLHLFRTHLIPIRFQTYTIYPSS